MIRARKRSLSFLLAVKMMVTACGVCLALAGLYAVYYTSDASELRRKTMEMQAHDILNLLKQGGDPTTLDIYKTNPRSYAFRVFDHRLGWRRRIIAETNIELLLQVGTHLGPEAGGGGRDLVRGVVSIAGGDIDGDGEPDNVWLMTERGDAGHRTYWIQAVMVDDAAGLWKHALARELVDHALIPTLFIAPALMIAAYFVARDALRPLMRTARQASDLGHAVAAGRPFAPISNAELPREFDGAVAGVNTMLAKLDRSLTLQKEFTSDVAHQLRTPLAVLALEISALPPGEARDRIKRELDELADLVNQLLRFAQAEDAMARQQDPVDIVTAARKVCEELAGPAFEEEKQIEFDAPDDGVVVSGHSALIDAAIRNIVDNAVKLSPRRATISVIVDAGPRIVVEDSGPGVPDAHKELIFERFWRADSGRRPGSGIGLALVRRIAFLHGGDVRVEDRPGGGARFVMTLGPPPNTA